MKNTERQQKLDYDKYNMSSNIGYDMTGKMRYCLYCDSHDNGACNKTQTQREEKSLCASAYNKMRRN